MSSMDVTPLTLDEIITIAKRDGAIWVVNYTDQGRKQSRGDYFMEVIDQTNQAQPVKIPNTWLPINLATFGQTSDVLRSPAFMSAIRNHMLVGVSPEDARKLLDTPSAEAEIERVNKENRGVVDGSVALPKKITLALNGSNTVASPPESFSARSEHNPSDEILKDLVARFNRNQISESHAEEALQGLSPLPSFDALISATESIAMKSSSFFRLLSEKIDEASPN